MLAPLQQHLRQLGEAPPGQVLKDARNEFHLAATGAGTWELSQLIESPAFTYTRVDRQPGEPTHATFSLEQSWSEQPLQFRLAATGGDGPASHIVLRIDGYLTVELPVELRARERLATDGAGGVQIYDAADKVRERVALRSALPSLSPGRHTVTLDARFAGDVPTTLELRLRGVGAPEVVRALRR